MNVRRRTARAWRAAMVAGGVAILLSGCQKVFWWRQKPDTVTVAVDRPPSPRPGLRPPTGGAPSNPGALTRKPEPRPEFQAQPEPQPQALPVPKKFSYPVALAVPGRENMVLSPFNQRLVDVAGFKSGSLVADPHYPMSDKKFFRVP